MAEENTTDSQSTTETQDLAPESQGTDSSTQTTETTSGSETGTSEDGKTILTGGAEEDQQTDKPVETDEEKMAREQREALFGAPEGDYELTLPEGVEGIDQEALAAVTPVARELGLSNEGLSKIAGVYATEVLPGVARQIVSGIEKDAVAQTAAWGTETLLAVQGGKDAEGKDIAPDPVFQGKTLKEVKAVAAKALDRFGGSDYREWLEATGVGNHPAAVRFAFLAGAAIAEDTSFERGSDAPKPKSRTELYYGPAKT